MTTYVYRNGKLVSKDRAEPRRTPWAVGIISDTMAPLKHMASGRTIDSKSRFRAETRATGCVEIGDQQITPRSPVRLDKSQRKEAIRKAIYDLKNGYRPQFASDD